MRFLLFRVPVVCRSPEITPEWLKHFEGSLRARGCSWNTVSTYLRTLRAVYNRAVDLRKAPYVPHLFRSVYTGTRADRRRALDAEDMKKVFARLLQSDAVTPCHEGCAGIVHPDVPARGRLLSIWLICVRVDLRGM